MKIFIVVVTVVVSRFEHMSFKIQSRSGNHWSSVMFCLSLLYGKHTLCYFYDFIFYLWFIQ